MVIIKTELFDELINDMSRCEKCKFMNSKNNVDCSLINIYGDADFAKKIPSIWTDWYNRLEADIMIIGQDWGPYSDMVKLNYEYLKNPTRDTWTELIEEEKSLTKKQLEKYLLESSNGKIEPIDNIFITNAIMCGRKGSVYRGNDINLKCSTLNCKDFLFRQIEIVSPKVILTLGYYPLLALSRIYDFKMEKNLTRMIENHPVIKVRDIVIIPLYHPVAQIKGERQMEQYMRIWEFI